MSERKHFISIWLFIGSLMLVYGILIFGTGIYEIYNPPDRHPVLAELRAPIWWGALLIVLGAIYVLIFRPRRGK
jgi:hypothetical protein